MAEPVSATLAAQLAANAAAAAAPEILATTAAAALPTAAAAVPAASYAIPGLVSSATPALAGTTAASSAIPGLIGSSPAVFAGANPLVNAMATGANGFPINASIGQTMAAEPSYWDQFTKFTQQNPVLTQMGFSTAKDMLTPERINAAPAMITQGRGQSQPVDWASAMNPYKQTMPQNKQISLLG
jgi:hypothetical protein